MINNKINANSEFAAIVKEIRLIVSKARYNVFNAVNTEMLKAYYEIGRKIVEEEQKGEKRAGYGKQLIDSLSRELIKEFGKGFSATALKNMRIFYKIYKDKIGQSATDEFYRLSWTHYCELIKIDEPSKRGYFEKYAITENLSVRDLKRQIYSLHYERLLMSKDKNALIGYEKRGNIPSRTEELIKDPYVLEFLDLDESKTYTEKEVETKILDDLQKFLLELGQGFSFVARQKRVTIDNDHFYIDLLLYNIHLKCYVVIELKSAKFRHEDAGQINFYLNYIKKELNKEGDNEPIGIILCAEKNNVQVEYAVAGMTNKMFVSKYKLYLPSKEELEREVRRLL
ncbi:MAG TPA: PDDEXK nuclease domain-containing protein [Candidatus Nanoarchaeia archaeon]|nr:PDDEXK nuclease domain-containing protein [Candidatus Nanoarchaeia archaeon]